MCDSIIYLFDNAKIFQKTISFLFLDNFYWKSSFQLRNFQPEDAKVLPEKSDFVQIYLL